MTEEQFYKENRLLFIAGDDSSFVTVMNKLTQRNKKYKIPHEGRVIECDSDDYYNMPEWLKDKAMAQIFNDYKVTINGN